MSGRVKERTLEEIRARVDIVELISSRGITLKRAGASFKGCCPFHREKTPSFHVSPARQAYYCFGCQAHGDAFTFMMAQDGLSFIEAVRALAEKTGVAIDSATDYESENRNRLYALHLELAAFYQRCLEKTADAAVARAYLETRKLPPDIVKRFGIGYAPPARHTLLRWAEKNRFTIEEMISAGLLVPPKSERQQDDYYDRFSGRLMFPICDTQGRVVAFSGRVLDPKSHPAKYVNSPETPIFRKGSILFALDKARAPLVKHPRREAVVCEGQIDVIRCHAAGLTTAVASQGTAFSREHAEILKRYADTAVLLFDGDEAGRKAAVRTGVVLLETGFPVRVAALPAGEDPDSLIREHGGGAVLELIEKAQSVVAFQIAAMRAAEKRPDAVDAFARVSRAVADTLAACATPMLRAHLQQEAAEIMGVPEAALAAEVAALQERQSEAASRAARYARPEGAPPTRDAPADSDGAPLHDPLAGTDGDDGDPDILLPPGAPSATPPATSLDQAPKSPPSSERSLAEMLFQYDDTPEISALLHEFLPGSALRHPHVRTIYAAWRNAGGSAGHGGALADLYTSADEPLRAFLDSIIRRHRPLADNDEISPLDAVRDVVARLWIDMLRAERAAIENDDAPESSRRRMILTQRIKALQQAPQEAERRNRGKPLEPVTSWLLREQILRAEMEIQARQ